MKETSHIFMLMLLFLACCITSCSNHKQQETLNRAESLMEAHPDSALSILEGIEKSELGSKEEQARYALLMSMALDRNYIESTSFDVIQPAIDYYLKSGNPNEQLRTYYYQGRIFQNKKDLDNALNSFVKGINNSLNCTDSLTLIRTLVAQAYLYYEFYDFDSYTKANLRAATICKKLSHKNYEFQCLLNALNGAILLENKNMADSLINLCNSFESLSYEHDKSLLEHQLSYDLKFGSKQDLASLLSHKNELLESDLNCTLNLAAAYNKLGDNHKSKDLLDYISNQDIDYDTLKYQSIYVAVLKDIGDYKNALSIYEDFSRRVDYLNSIKFDQKAQSIEEKHQIELQAEQDARKKNKIIWSCITGIIFLVLIVVILFLLFRSNKTQKDLAIEKAKNTELENKQLKSEKDKAIQEAKIKDLENDRLKSEKDKAISEAKIKNLENENLKAERDKKALEAENLAHRVEILENESASLKELMDSQEELPSEVQDAIKVRIEMLNALMAGYITNNDQYEKPYESWIKELTNNTEEFMNSNRLAFQVSHPRFIQYFEDHDLTISEINYVCLYAIGLRGKEVGNYIKKRSHVNISSGIRKKLGIDKHETNIGIYVRKLLKKL
ncbi:MAG: hypothetical protein HDS62_02790 [Bacteroidales bacterium]|nr:hypothetical protein [Bacteroidales bacterium]